jgi:acetyl esterase/lipase
LQFYREAKYYSEKGLTVFCVDYRISSLYHSTPSNAFEDCADAMTFIRHHAKDYKIRPDSIALAGASAGGNMALCLAEGVGGKEARPNLLITYYPTLEEPSRHIASDIPPVKFIIGDKDQFTPEDTALTFVEHLRDVGSRVEFHLLKGYGHPIFHYRESLNSVFYYIRALTDDFLRRYKFLL